MSDTPPPPQYIPFVNIPEEVHAAALTLQHYFEQQGCQEWQFSAVADGRLVGKLERELNAAKAENDSKLALIKRLHLAITARMSADEPTGDERLELSLAWKEAQETIDKAKL
jgi:hypothetical protein